MEIVRNNNSNPYRLHDVNIVDMIVDFNKIKMYVSPGMFEIEEPYDIVEGHIEFNWVEWDFSYVYILDFVGNTGIFSGEKMFLKDFLKKYPEFYFEICDETYGFNQSKYSGYLIENGTRKECMIEIYHAGDMIYVTERQDKFNSFSFSQLI